MLLPDIDVQANLEISFGYGRPDDLSDTPLSIMQNVIDDNLSNNPPTVFGYEHDMVDLRIHSFEKLAYTVSRYLENIV